MLSFIWPKLKVNQELHVLQASERDMEKRWTLKGPWCCILMKFHRSFIKMLQDYRKRHGGKMESCLKPHVYHEPPYPPRLQEETWLGVWICFIKLDLNETFTENYSYVDVFRLLVKSAPFFVKSAPFLCCSKSCGELRPNLTQSKEILQQKIL